MKTRYLVAVAALFAGATALSFTRDAMPTAVTQPAAVAPAVAATAIPTSWLTDPDDAAATAVASGKDLLVQFAAPGSAEPSALDAPAFSNAAAQAFVLVRLSSSADAPVDSATRVAAWGERLGVTQLPAIVLLDSRGRPYADSIWQGGDVGAALQLLKRLSDVRAQRDAELTAAATSLSIERARHLEAALQAVGRFATAPAYVETLREIVSLDKENAAGLKTKYAAVVAGIDVDVAIQSDVYPLIDKGDLAGAIARIDRIVLDTNPPAGQRQLLLAFKGQLYFSLHDSRGATKAFDEAIGIDPYSETAAKVLAARQQVLGGTS